MLLVLFDLDNNKQRLFMIAFSCKVQLLLLREHLNLLIINLLISLIIQTFLVVLLLYPVEDLDVILYFCFKMRTSFFFSSL